jgi:hypothetical protein
MKDREGEGGGRDLITRHRSRFPECLHPSLFSASPCTPSPRHPSRATPASPLRAISPTPLPQPPRTVNTGDVGPSRSRPTRRSSSPRARVLPLAEYPINSRHRGYSDRVAKICGARGAINECAISLREIMRGSHLSKHPRHRRARAAKHLDHPRLHVFKEKYQCKDCFHLQFKTQKRIHDNNLLFW